MKERLFISILFVTLLVSVKTLAQKTPHVPTLRVVGRSSIKAIPEDFNVQIPVSVKDSFYLACSKRLVATINTIKKALKTVGIDEDRIQSNRFSIAENFYYDRPTGKRKKDGYQGKADLEIVDFYTPEMLSKIIGVLMKNERPHSLHFQLSEKQKEQLTEKAITEAVADAHDKAKRIAKYAGVDLVSIAKIVYDYQNYGMDQLTAVQYNIKADNAAYEVMNNLELNPKELSIEKKVLIEWAIRNNDQ